jgi:hypothetical protein
LEPFLFDHKPNDDPDPQTPENDDRPVAFFANPLQISILFSAQKENG